MLLTNGKYVITDTQLTCKASPVLRTLSIRSEGRKATPRYMNWSRIWRSGDRVPSRMTMSWPLSGALANILEKWVLHAASTRRCALNDSPEEKNRVN